MSGRIAVVGTGLMGASVGLGARAAGVEVRGWDSDPANLAAAADRGAVEAASSLDEALDGVELAVVAVRWRGFRRRSRRCSARPPTRRP